MNGLFVILPLVSSNNEGLGEQTYLKILQIKDPDKVTRFLIDIYSHISYVGYERFSCYYDHNRLNALIQAAKSLRHDRKYPEADRILSLFSKKRFEPYQSKCAKLPSLFINGAFVEDGIVNAYSAFGEAQKTLVNPDVLSCTHKALRIEDETHNPISANIVLCDGKKLYEWFVSNRNPERELDKNYKKHSDVPRNGYKGVISPLTYSLQQTKDFLTKAVGAEDAKTLFFMDLSRNKIIVFWNENLQHKPTYHAYEVSADDAGELDKIYRKGGRSLVDKLYDVSHTDGQ